MITREDAKTLLGTAYSKINCGCIDKGLCTHQSDAFALERTFNQIYDSFEQHIKSLEAQLANTELLMCEGCVHQRSFKPESITACSTCSCGRKYNYKKDIQ